MQELVRSGAITADAALGSVPLHDYPVSNHIQTGTFKEQVI
ncbi:MAG: hypothetical protein OEQ12_06710 [Nitrosopumilus sp.]|nr:hypothetical protein [Nitrosopumilus sp.]